MEKLFNYCPNCKSTNIFFEHNHKLECTNCQFVYFHNVAAAVAVIIRHEDKILFSIRNNAPMKGYYDLPGGFIDPNETAEMAAKRELKEELGIEIAYDLEYFSSQPNVYQYRNILYNTCDIAFVANLSPSAIQNLDLNEIQAIEWVKITEIAIDRIGFKSLKKIVSDYISRC